MTRDEYRQLLREYFQDKGWELYSNHMSFPQLLNGVAVELFIRNDSQSKFAVETRRRLKQLNETGITDK